MEYINPADLTITRLNKLTRCWERYCFGRYGEWISQDVPDAVQQAFCVFCRHVKEDPAKNTWAFLNTIILSKIKACLRKRLREQSLVDATPLDAPIQDGKEGALSDIIPDPDAIDPAYELINHVEREKLRAVLGALTPRQRHVIEQHYFHYRSLVQIARDLKVSPQAVSASHQRALFILREELLDQEEDE
jgi:RNA polymerase sigma factor (sigma-70 family)